MSIKFNVEITNPDPEEGQETPVTVRAHPDASWGKTRQQAKLAPLNHSEPVCQQVVSSHKSSNALTLSAGRFLRGPVPPLLTQIGNVTHPQQNWSSKRDRELTVTTLDGETPKTTGSEPRLGSHGTHSWLTPWSLMSEHGSETTEKVTGRRLAPCTMLQSKEINLFSLSDRSKWQSAMTRVVSNQTQQESASQTKCQLQRRRHESEPGESCGMTGRCSVSTQCCTTACQTVTMNLCLQFNICEFYLRLISFFELWILP